MPVKVKETEITLDSIPVIKIDLNKTLSNYSDAYGRMVHAPYGSPSYKKELYRMHLELGKIKSVVEEAESFYIDSIPKALSSRTISHMKLEDMEKRLNRSVLYKDLISRLYTVYNTFCNYLYNHTYQEKDPNGYNIIKNIHLSKKSIQDIRNHYKQLQSSYDREVKELSFYVRSYSNLRGFTNYRDAIASENYELSEHVLAYLNTLLYNQLVALCNTFLTSSDEVKKNFIKGVIRYVPGCPGPGYILNMAIDDDKNIAVTKAITTYYTPEDIDMDISKSVSVCSFNTFRYLVCNGYREFLDEDTCVARAALIPNTEYEINPIEILRLCELKPDTLTNVSVIILNCIDTDNDVVFEYLLRNKYFHEEDLLGYNTIFSFVSDVLKYRKFRFFYTFTKYYKIEKEILIRIWNEINIYTFVASSYPGGSLAWLKSIIDEYE